MGKKNRSGKFPWEKGAALTPQSLRGLNDPALVADCRSAADEERVFVQSWIALCSPENWGEGCLTPDGRPDGDTGWREEDFVPLEELAAADFFGRPLEGAFVFDDADEDEEFFLLLATEEKPVPVKVKTGQEYIPAPTPEISAIFTEAESREFHPAEDLPLWAKNSHKIAGGSFESNRDRRYWSGNFRRSCQCGRRGNDRYKSRRVGFTPISRRKVRRVIRKCPPIDLSRRRLPIVAY